MIQSWKHLSHLFSKLGTMDIQIKIKYKTYLILMLFLSYFILICKSIMPNLENKKQKNLLVFFWDIYFKLFIVLFSPIQIILHKVMKLLRLKQLSILFYFHFYSYVFNDIKMTFSIVQKYLT